MFVVAVTKSAWHAVGEHIASFLMSVYHTFSETRPGQARLARLARRSRLSSSTCCPTGATWSG